MIGYQMGLAEWWQHNDIVVIGVFITLLLLSLLSWTVILYKIAQLLRLERLERRVVAELRRRGNCQEMAQWVPPQAPSYQILMEAVRLPLGHRAEDDAQVQAHHLEHHAERLTQGHRVELESYMIALATIGNSAPFIGLLGTVWGIMLALQGLGGAESLTMDVVSGPIGEALVATALGLFVAIPAVVGYNLLLRRLRQLNTLTDRNLRHFIQLSAMDGMTPLLAAGRG